MTSRRRKFILIGLFTIVVVVVYVAVPKSEYYLHPIKDKYAYPPEITPPEFLVPRGIPEPSRDFSTVPASHLRDSGLWWLREALEHPRDRDSDVRQLLTLIPHATIERFRTEDPEMDALITFVTDTLPIERAREDAIAREADHTHRSNYPPGMVAKAAWVSGTLLRVSLVNESDTIIAAMVGSGFLEPIRGNIGFTSWRTGDTQPYQFRPSLGVACGWPMTPTHYAPGYGLEHQYDLAPLLTRQGHYRILVTIAYPASTVIEVEINRYESIRARLKSLLFFTSYPLWLRLFT